MLTRRGLITGLISLAAAPAIVRYSSLMPVKSVPIIGWDLASERDITAYFIISNPMNSNEWRKKFMQDYEFYKGSQW
jgi:hypothetical protein